MKRKRSPIGSIAERLKTLQSRGWVRIGKGGNPMGLTGRRKKVRLSPLSKAVIEDRR